MSGLSVGMLGFVLSLLGMECTFIGGKERSKHKKIYAGGCCHITSGNVTLTELSANSCAELGNINTIGLIFILMCFVYLLMIVYLHVCYDCNF